MPFNGRVPKTIYARFVFNTLTFLRFRVAMWPSIISNGNVKKYNYNAHNIYIIYCICGRFQERTKNRNKCVLKKKIFNMTRESSAAVTAATIFL